LFSTFVGCARGPTLGIEAEVGSDTPLALNLAATQPVTLNAAIGMDQPLTVTIEGLAVPYEGTFITEALFDQVKENDSAEYVAAIFGKPDFESVLGDGTTVWRWKYRPTAQVGSVFSVFGNNDKKEPSPDHITAFAIFKDGKLARKWRG
jgi:hypothetical protein